MKDPAYTQMNDRVQKDPAYTQMKDPAYTR